MSSDCCCTKTIRLCKVSVCQDAVIDFGITAQVDGVHQMILNFLGVEILIEETFVFDDQIIFPVGNLNENFTYSGRLYDPNGKQVVIEKDGVIYDCFEFQTVIRYSLMTEIIES